MGKNLKLEVRNITKVFGKNHQGVAGEILIDGQNITHVSEEELRALAG
ncbi:hypothetical protein [Methanosarcina horonobensis]|nr:hypothetical protein [Methanosarcina horonobensis]